MANRVHLFKRMLLLNVVSSIAAAHSTCDVTPAHEGTRVDCHNRGLESVPTDIYNISAVAYLDLSLNNIKLLGPNVFQNFSHLTNLNLPFSGVETIDVFALRGLHHLRTLDISNNPVLQHALTSGIFESCSSLKELLTSGSPQNGETFLPLVNLESLTMTPNEKNMPYELTKLPRLSVLNFAFCAFTGNMTRAMMLPFRQARLKELAFYDCNITHIENGAFDYFTHLRLLNFACNTYANVSNIMQVLSDSAETQVESLVLDLVGAENMDSPVLLGIHENRSCLRAWDHIKRISMRGIKLLGFLHGDCFENVEPVAFGFNTPFVYGKLHFWDFIQHLKRIRHVDVSYLMVNDFAALMRYTGCGTSLGWVPSNDRYFPNVPPKFDIDVCNTSGPHIIPTNNETLRILPPGCLQINIPMCMTYVRVDHLDYMSSSHFSSCKYFSAINNVKYFNISFRQFDHYFNASKLNIHGANIDRLEILDISCFGLNAIGDRIVHMLKASALREFHAGQNNLGSGHLPDNLTAANLELLDLSSNNFKSFPPATFMGLPKLKYLYLHANSLADMTWISPTMSQLHFINIKNNKLEYIEESAMSALDRLSPSLLIDISGNPLLCLCSHLKFLEWIIRNQAKIVSFHMLTCSGAETIGDVIKNIDINIFRKQCQKNNVPLVATTTAFSSFIAIVLLATAVVYKFRWTIRWKYHKWQLYQRQKKQQLLVQNSVNGEELYFSTFVIFPMEDDEIRSWVFGQFRNQIESYWHKPNCFLRGRNDIPGQYDVVNIMEGLTHSHTAVWVICPSFFDDKWCEIAANFAFLHMGRRRNLLLLMENRLAEYRSPKSFAHLMNAKHDIPELTYSVDDENAKRLFWSELNTFIPSSI